MCIFSLNKSIQKRAKIMKTVACKNRFPKYSFTYHFYSLLQELRVKISISPKIYLNHWHTVLYSHIKYCFMWLCVAFLSISSVYAISVQRTPSVSEFQYVFIHKIVMFLSDFQICCLLSSKVIIYIWKNQSKELPTRWFSRTKSYTINFKVEEGRRVRP